MLVKNIIIFVYLISVPRKKGQDSYNEGALNIAQVRVMRYYFFHKNIFVSNENVI